MELCTRLLSLWNQLVLLSSHSCWQLIQMRPCTRPCVYFHQLKVAFFRKYDEFFKSPNLQKKYSKKTILNLKFKIPAHNSIMLWAGILDFKFRIVIWNTIFWRFEKHIFLKKKPPLGFWVFEPLLSNVSPEQCFYHHDASSPSLLFAYLNIL